MTSGVCDNSIASGLRLSSRRGSLSAPDPLAQNMDQETPRGLASRLTIIRISPSLEPSSPVTGCSANEEASGPKKPRSRPRSATCIGTTKYSCTGSESSKNTKPRVSFAFSSFSRSGESRGIERGLGSDPPSLPRNTPSRSPVRSFATRNRSRSYSALPMAGSSTFQTRQASLSPEQIHDLARTSLGTTDGTSEHETPISVHFGPPAPHDLPSASQSSPRSPDCSPRSPSVFIPLPETHYLPFIERPSEVESLLSSEGNRQFMALLKQTFPPNLRDVPGNAGEKNPVEWSFPCLVSFLTRCPRSKCPDPIWVSKVRRCIRARSEAIWERFKDIIGVPPDLDVNEPFTRGELESGDQKISGAGEEDAWVEPMFPSTSLPAASPVSPVNTGEPAFVGRGNVMETIGEREEDDTVQAVTNPRANSFEAVKAASTGHLTPSEPISALRLYTRLSFSEGQTTLPVATSSVSSDATSTIPSGRSFSHGYRDGASLHLCDGLERPFSHEHVRRPSAGSPAFERGPGNPLFPSNFGRLSIGPTLAANNPTLRQQIAPLPSAYLAPLSPHLTYSQASGPSAPPSVERLHLPESRMGSDYAITIASGSDRSS